MLPADVRELLERGDKWIHLPRTESFNIATEMIGKFDEEDDYEYEDDYEGSFKSIRDTNERYHSLCRTVKIRHELPSHYRDRYYEEIFCESTVSNNSAVGFSHHRNVCENLKFRSKNFKCIQHYRQIVLYRRDSFNNWVSDEAQEVASGCECMMKNN